MKINSLVAIIVGIIVVGAGFIVLTTDFDSQDDTIKTVPETENEPTNLGNITSFDEAVNAFAFNFYKEF